MAKINPQISPTQDPSYLHLSKPITQPQANVATEVALKGIGNVGSTAIDAYNTYQEEGLKEEVQKQAGETRQQYLSELGVPGSTAGPNVLEAHAEVSGAPQEVGDLGHSLGAIAASRANGKMSETMYYALLDQKASALRNRYPGQREFIDRQFEKVTGVNPANALLRSRLADLNAAQGKAQELVNKGLALTKEMAGDPIADQLTKGLLDGSRTYEDVFHYYSKFKEIELKAHRNSLLREQAKGQEEDISKQSQNDARDILPTIQEKYFRGIGTLSGQNNMTAQQIWDEINSGKEIDPVTLENHVRALSTLRARAYAEGWKHLHDSSAGPSIASGLKGGDADAKKMIDDSLSLFDLAIERITNKDNGTAHAAERAVQGIEKGATLGLYTNKNDALRNYALKAKAISALGDAAAKNFFDTYAIGSGMRAEFSTWLSDTAADALLHGADPNQPQVSMKEKIRQASSNEATNDPKIHDKILGIADQIANPAIDDKQKRQLIYWTFKPENQGVLDNIAPDYTDPVTGRKVSGATTMFNRLTSKGIAEEVDRMSKQDPRIGEMYQTWTQGEFRRLFQADLLELNKIAMRPDVKIGWDDEQKQFITKYQRDINAPAPTPRPPGMDVGHMSMANRFAAQDSIDRINQGLRTFRHVAEQFGYDTDGYLMNVMHDFGLNPDESADKPASAMFAAMMKSKIQRATQQK